MRAACFDPPVAITSMERARLGLLRAHELELEQVEAEELKRDR